jgi:galactokinase/mevalonate kinase-like predicted kinase
MNIVIKDLYNQLALAREKDSIPSIVAYNRIDGPGSSLDLREFQQAFWKLPKVPNNLQLDPSASWSIGLPRTVGITIDFGTRIEALPLESPFIGIHSIDCNTKITAKPGEIPPIKDNWLLKIIELFGIQGVQFRLKNIRDNTISSGLGGSATVASGVCLLANELAGRPFSKIQLISMASRMEQDLGVSITGTQEQSNVFFGGVTDYIWFPWGIPGKLETGYGTSVRYKLIPETSYDKIEERMAIYHTGINRLSSKVNHEWIAKLYTKEGYQLHSQKMGIAYKFREALRLQKWHIVRESIEQYRNIRTQLCYDYMNGVEDIANYANENDCSVFPLGAGGGGAILIVSEKPESLGELREVINTKYIEIPFKIKSKGHEFLNIGGFNSYGRSGI